MEVDICNRCGIEYKPKSHDEVVCPLCTGEESPLDLYGEPIQILKEYEANKRLDVFNKKQLKRRKK